MSSGLLQVFVDKHRKKAGGYIGRNVVEITIKMKTIARKPLMIKNRKIFTLLNTITAATNLIILHSFLKLISYYSAFLTKMQRRVVPSIVF